MSRSHAHIIFADDWSDDQIESVRAALRDDPELRTAVRRWIALSSAVGDGLRRDLPSSEALVLFALYSSARNTEYATDLSDDERRLLDGAAQKVESSIENHPAVRHILDRIRADADDFSRCWNEATSGQSGQPGRSDEPARTDRAPVHSRSGLRLISPRWIAAAAAVVVLAVSTMLLFGPDATVENNRTTWTADAGTFRLVDLPDGTDLRLAGPATLSYDDDQPRTVDLTGSAFFNVTPSDTRFTISTSTATVEVLGTSFGVQSDGRSTEVTLVDGSLRLASLDGRMVQLEPGHRSRVTVSGGPDAPVRVDVAGVLRWTGLFVFRDTPLTDVARTLGEEYDIRIDIGDDLKDETLTGTFAQEQGVVEILRVISAALSANLDMSEDRTRFTLKR